MFSNCTLLESFRIIVNFDSWDWINYSGDLLVVVELTLNTLVNVPLTVGELAVEFRYSSHEGEAPPVVNDLQLNWESADIALSGRPGLASVAFTLRAVNTKHCDPTAFLDKERESLELRFPRLAAKSLLSFSTVYGKVHRVSCSSIHL